MGSDERKEEGSWKERDIHDERRCVDPLGIFLKFELTLVRVSLGRQTLGENEDIQKKTKGKERDQQDFICSDNFLKSARG